MKPTIVEPKIWFWEVIYETSGLAGRGPFYLQAYDLRQACDDFLRFYRNRQDVDAQFPEVAAYWGRLFFMKVHLWTPYEVAAEGHLITPKIDYIGKGYFEWKIDGSAAGFSPEKWVELTLGDKADG